jgi:hypothetical protein
MLQRCGLRSVGALEIASAQSVFRLLHGLSGGVQIIARRCASFVRHAPRRFQTLTDLCLALGEVVATLTPLLIAAAAALAILLLLLFLARFVTQGALLTHRLRELVHALLHLLVLFAFTAAL